MHSNIYIQTKREKKTNVHYHTLAALFAFYNPPNSKEKVQLKASPQQRSGEALPKRVTCAGRVDKSIFSLKTRCMNVNRRMTHTWRLFSFRAHNYSGSVIF